MLKAILFDMDDTLVDWSTRSVEWADFERQHLAHVVRHIADKGHRIGEPDAFYTTVRRLANQSWVDAAASLLAPNYGQIIAQGLISVGAPAELVNVDEVLMAFHWRHIDGVVAFPDALEVLPLLAAAGIDLGIVTNAATPMWMRDRELEAMGLLDYFSHCRLSAVDVGYIKPHPAIFNRALEALGVATDEVVFVGDNPEADILGAQNVGIKAVLRDLRHPKQVISDDVEPDATIHTLHDLLPVLDSWYPEWRL
jgi:putative hydrolase of the HAD superfamily